MTIFGFSLLGIVEIIVGFVVAWVIYSLSVYITARIIGVQVPFLRALFVTLIADIVSSIISFIIVAGFLFTSDLVVLIKGLITGFVITLAIYKYLFDIDWVKTFVMLIIAKIIDFVIISVLALIFANIGFLALGNTFSSLSAAP
jgi:hypothetical protein